jgi:succinate dehydrogenase / fumarate reductase cytochrome b subunit
MYTLHRITGLGILSYFLLHVLVTSLGRVLGKEAWEATMGFLHQPAFLFGEMLVYVAFCIHGLNGIRLVLIELGLLVGKPEEPIYPYRTSLNKQRPVLILCMIVAALFVVLGGYNFLRLTSLS